MKSKLKIIGWILFAVAVIITMRYVKIQHDERIMKTPDIFVDIPEDNVFLNSKEVEERLKNLGIQFENVMRKDIQATVIEKALKSMPEIEDARVFLYIDGNWKIYGKIRKPIARVFNTAGESYYIDDKGKKMSLSPIYTARVIPVTGKINDRLNKEDVAEIINNDSLKSIRLLPQMYSITKYVCNDAFLHAMIAQIHIENNGDFVLIPRVGTQQIIFGRVGKEASIAERFEKLKTFYREAMPHAGWSKYETINLKFNKQIVCTKRTW